MNDSIPHTLKFTPDIISLIARGEKTIAYRLGTKYDSLMVGDEILIADNNDVPLGKARITEKSYTKFKDLPLSKQGHETFASEEEKREAFERYYNRKVLDNELVIVFGFKMLTESESN
jgi:hypothetical protein